MLRAKALGSPPRTQSCHLCPSLPERPTPHSCLKSYPSAASAGADGVQGVHFSPIQCCALARLASGDKGYVSVFTRTINTWCATEFLLMYTKKTPLALKAGPLKVLWLQLSELPSLHLYRFHKLKAILRRGECPGRRKKSILALIF